MHTVGYGEDDDDKSVGQELPGSLGQSHIHSMYHLKQVPYRKL